MVTTSRGRYALRLSVFVVAACLAPLASQAQEASIIGQVADDTGAVLPGVTVVATSPALQVKQVTDVTNERGEYRLTPLPLGTYSVALILLEREEPEAGFVGVGGGQKEPDAGM